MIWPFSGRGTQLGRTCGRVCACTENNGGSESKEYRNHVRLSCQQEAISIINNQSVIADNRMMLLNAMDSHQDDARYG